MDVSFQLYSARNVADQNGYLKTLVSLGYNQVEGFSALYKDPSAYRAAMDDAGISMPSGHFGLADLETNFVGQIAIAKQLGMQQLYVPYLAAEDRPTDTAGYQAIGKRLQAIQQKVLDEGLDFGWHNHDFELIPLADGSVPMDVLLNEVPEMSWEADLAWVSVAKADPTEWVEKFGSRISAVHVKDIAAEGENTDEDGWADVGEGVIDWKSLIAKVRHVAPNALSIMEHDNPSDAERFASVSYKNFVAY